MPTASPIRLRSERSSSSDGGCNCTYCFRTAGASGAVPWAESMRIWWLSANSDVAGTCTTQSRHTDIWQARPPPVVDFRRGHGRLLGRRGLARSAHDLHAALAARACPAAGSLQRQTDAGRPPPAAWSPTGRRRCGPAAGTSRGADDSTARGLRRKNSSRQATKWPAGGKCARAAH